MNRSFSLLVVVLFFSSANAIAAEHPPVGYLVPAPDSIPDGLYQVQRLYPAYSDDRYGLEYRGPDNQASLAISETPGSLGVGFDKLLDGRKTASGYVKIGDVERLGARGTLFKTSLAGISGYDLFLNDNGKVLRIEAQDGPKFHFTEEMVKMIVNRLTRHP
jgi:hypothetical protein